jgi:hypothetical protein
LGFVVLTGALWLAFSSIWFIALRIRRNRLLWAAALGLVTTIAAWVVVAALFAGWTND